MDRAGWWNTNAVLGRYGAIAVGRGLPRTHRFARARVVFTVARSRCEELFDAPGSVTLWRLPAEVEDAFDEHWQGWLAQSESWNPFFDSLAEPESTDLISELEKRELITPSQIDTVNTLRRSAEGRAVPIPGERSLGDDLVALLAAGFSKGEPKTPAIPYARLVG